MTKRLPMVWALLAVIAMAFPAFALEFKYGGLYQVRWQSNNNVTDGNSDAEDNQNYFDQRLRMYFSFIASENLQVVTKWELDTLWGESFDKFHSGGSVGADSINLEMKNVYVDFTIPYTPVRSTLGVQGISMLTGWIIDDDFSAAKFSAKFDPIHVTVGYIAAQNNDVTNEQENVDDWFISLDYTQGSYKAALVGFFQYGHNTDVSTFFNPRMSTGSFTQGGTGIRTGFAEDNMLFDLGVNFAYKLDWVSAYLNFVKNFGSFDLFSSDDSMDYTGYMIEAGANFFFGPLTFNVGGFLASGENFESDEDSDGNFRYPRGASHYWSEILGLGTLNQMVGADYLNPVRAPGTTRNPGTGDQLRDGSRNNPRFHGYMAADVPSNLWMVNAGMAYQALEKTKLTFNYYYIGTQEKVLAGDHFNPALQRLDDEFSSSIGHELDFYIDQGIVDGLSLRVVGAYLFANEGYTVNNDDNDAWETGFRILWSF